MRQWLFIAMLLCPFFINREVFATPLTPDQLLLEAGKGRVEFLKAISDVEGTVATITTKEELFPYLLVLDRLSELEKSYEMESLGHSPVKSLGISITNASTKWMRLDTDQATLVQMFMKYATNNARSSLAEQQPRYLRPDTSLQEYIVWIDKATWAIRLATENLAEGFVILSYEELQATVVGRIFKNVTQMTDEQIESVIVRANAVASLNEVAAYMRSVAAGGDSVESLLRSMRLARAFDIAIKSNPRCPMVLQSAPADTISDALQRLVNMRGFIPDQEVQQAVDILTPAVLGSISGLVISLSDRFIYPDQLDFIGSLARGLSRRLLEFGMTQQHLALETYANRIQILKRLYARTFEGTYDLTFTHLGPGKMTLLHTGGGRFAITVSLYKPSGEIPFTMLYFTYDTASDTFQATHAPYDNPEFPIEPTVNTDLFFRFTGESDCIKGSFGYPAGQDSFTGCLTEHVTVFDKAFLGPQRTSYSSVWDGVCRDKVVHLRISQVGPRLVGNMRFDLGSFAIPFNFGTINQDAHSVVLTSGEAEDVQRFFQVRALYKSDDELEVEYIVGGRGIMCHTNFHRVPRDGM